MAREPLLGGGTVFHQFVHLGDLCLAQGNSTITKDIQPYRMAYQMNRLIGLNTIGLRRAGIDPSTRSKIKDFYRAVFFSKLPLQEELKNPSRKGVCFPNIQ